MKAPPSGRLEIAKVDGVAVRSHLPSPHQEGFRKNQDIRVETQEYHMKGNLPRKHLRMSPDSSGSIFSFLCSGQLETGVGAEPWEMNVQGANGSHDMLLGAGGACPKGMNRGAGGGPTVPCPTPGRSMAWSEAALEELRVFLQGGQFTTMPSMAEGSAGIKFPRPGNREPVGTCPPGNG